MLTVLGLFFQLNLVLKRKALSFEKKIQEKPTAILSLNQLNSIYLACYAFFLYGICESPMNHYLAWPRFLAMLVLMVLFYQILIDRKNLSSALVFYLTASMLVLSLFIFWYRETTQQFGKFVAQGLVIFATLVLVQGYIHQILLIRRFGKTGAVSIRFHQCVLLTALSTVAFGFAIGIKEGWPLILLASVSSALKIVTLWHFRWVRLSELAEQRRKIA